MVKKAVNNENGRTVLPFTPNSPSNPAIPCVINVHPGIILPISNKMIDNTIKTPTLYFELCIMFIFNKFDLLFLY